MLAVREPFLNNMSMVVSIMLVIVVVGIVVDRVIFSPVESWVRDRLGPIAGLALVAIQQIQTCLRQEGIHDTEIRPDLVAVDNNQFMHSQEVKVST